MDIRTIKQRFEDIGGTFITSPQNIRKALKDIRVLLFDWDGVMNDGMKNGDTGSPFGEADSLGINLWRLSYWLEHEELPVIGVLSGAANNAGKYLAKREHFDCFASGFTNKAEGFKALADRIDFEPSEVAFFFDDVLDIPIAEISALGFAVRRNSSPMFIDYVKRNKIADYLTSVPGGQAAVRECMELMIALGFDYDASVKVRKEFGAVYKEYVAARKEVKTVFVKA